jgi:hypothetical protein
MLGYILLALELLTPNQPVQTGIASTFYPVERWNDGRLACAGRSDNLKPRRHWTYWRHRDMPVCASRTIPCGTWVLVHNQRTQKSSWCVIGDRGPYGAVLPVGVQPPNGAPCRARRDGRCWYVKRRRKQPGRWQGVIDIGPSVEKSIGSDGWDRVSLWWWTKGKEPKVVRDIIRDLDARLRTEFGPKPRTPRNRNQI